MLDLDSLKKLEINYSCNVLQEIFKSWDLETRIKDCQHRIIHNRNCYMKRKRRLRKEKIMICKEIIETKRRKKKLMEKHDYILKEIERNNKNNKSK